MAESPFFTAFPRIELPLSIEDWERLPRNPAYKYEYFGDRAVLSPRPWTRSAVLDLDAWRPVRLRHPPALRTLEPGDWKGLADLFHRGFVMELPFQSLPDRKARALARRVLRYTREGGDGDLVPEAGVLAETGEGPVGAALVTMVEPRRHRLETAAAKVPHLTWIFVPRLEHRHGYGSALLGGVVERLRARGHPQLLSTFLVGSASALWHWQNGFRLLSSGFGRMWREEEGEPAGP